MRISDWSSDVCSSDLFAHEPGVESLPIKCLQKGFAPLGKAHEGCVAVAGAVETSRNRQGHEASPIRVDRKQGPLRRGAKRALSPRVGGSGRGIRCGRCPPLDRFGSPLAALAAAAFLRFLAETMRSEEHTSELQSLMRISYAVICLKK